MEGDVHQRRRWIVAFLHVGVGEDARSRLFRCRSSRFENFAVGSPFNRCDFSVFHHLNAHVNRLPNQLKRLRNRGQGRHRSDQVDKRHRQRLAHRLSVGVCHRRCQLMVAEVFRRLICLHECRRFGGYSIRQHQLIHAVAEVYHSVRPYRCQGDANGCDAVLIVFRLIRDGCELQVKHINRPDLARGVARHVRHNQRHGNASHFAERHRCGIACHIDGLVRPEVPLNRCDGRVV